MNEDDSHPSVVVRIAGDADFYFERQAFISWLTPQTEAGREWVDEFMPEYGRGRIMMEHEEASELVRRIINDGLSVTQVR